MVLPGDDNEAMYHGSPQLHGVQLNPVEEVIRRLQAQAEEDELERPIMRVIHRMQAQAEKDEDDDEDEDEDDDEGDNGINAGDATTQRLTGQLGFRDGDDEDETVSGDPLPVCTLYL